MRRLLIAAMILTMAGQARAESDWIKDVFDKQAASKAAPAAPGRPGQPGRTAAAILPGQAPPAGDAAAKPGEPPKPLKPILPPAFGRWAWKVTKATWSAADEAGYAAFVSQIGESDCGTVHDCITSPTANPLYHAKNPPYFKFYADCADLPYFLRAYYAFHNGLPFSFSIRYASHPRAAGNKTKVLGNQIAERFDIVGPGPDARLAIASVGQFVSSEHFRTPPGYVGNLLPDHYPVRLDRESIRPGTVIFDPEGHVAVVTKVTDDGRILYIDAHPDNTLTRGVYNREFARAQPEMGAGFKRWRPQTLKGAFKGQDGTLHGGRIVLATDRELADWSDEQFYGNEDRKPLVWSDGRFVIGQKEYDYYDFLRLRLAYKGFRYDPITETRQMIQDICQDLNYRVEAVDLAIRAGMNKRPQPPKLPNNIFATKGDWELYSTPSRDARLKTAFKELRDEVARFIALEKSNSELLAYKGGNLRRDLADAYAQETSKCRISYVRTNGSKQELGFDEIVGRLFRFSFDPHHCVELRWGASSKEELASCPDDAEKRVWYEAQVRLRNQIVRTYGEPMGWGLAELQNTKIEIGDDAPPDIDTAKVLMADTQ